VPLTESMLTVPIKSRSGAPSVSEGVGSGSDSDSVTTVCEYSV